MKNIRIIVFISLGVFLFLLINHLYINTNYYSNRYGELNKFENVPQDIEILNVGSSHGKRGFVYENYENLRTFNFGLSGQTFYYDSILLKKYRNRIGERAIIIIPISYPSFQELDKEDLKMYDGKYLKFLDYADLENSELKDLLVCKYFPVTTAKQNLKKVVYDDERVYKDKIIGSKGKIDMSKIAKKKYKVFSEIQEFNSDSLSLKILENIINFCLENGWKPVLVTTPITDQLNEYYDGSEFLKKWRKQIDYYENKYNIQYLDYSHDEEFSSNLSFFMNSDHLNYAGGKKFTEKVFRDIGIVK